ncbi:MAG: PQQ-binding-like beta-propeller repeat protein [Pseudohongiellaceae bacterium]
MNLKTQQKIFLAVLLLLGSGFTQAQSQWVDSFGSSGNVTISGAELSVQLFGDFIGTVSASDGGYLFLGYWDDAVNANECGPNNQYAGPIRLLFNSAINSFTGSFGYCREGTTWDDLIGRNNYTGTLQSGALDFSSISGDGGGATNDPVDVDPISVSLNWQSNGTAGFTWSTPIVLENGIFLQDQDGGFDLFNKADGSKLYSKKPANAFPTNSPTYTNGFVYMIAGGLLKIDPATGEEIGKFSNTGIASQAPASHSNLVYVADNSTVYGVNATSMEEVWNVNLGTTNYIDVAVSGDILYVFAEKLFALNPLTGAEYWNLALPNGRGTQVGSIGNGFLTVFDNGSTDVKLHTYKLNADPKLAPSNVWSADFGDNSADRSPPVIDGKMVFATSRVGVLRAFQLEGDGTIAWEKTVRGSGSAPALSAATNGVIVIQEEVSPGVYQVAGYNGSSGTEVFKTAIESMGVSWGQPVIKDSVVYLATDHSGALYSISVPGLSGTWSMIKGNAQLTGGSLGGVRSEVDEATLTIDIPQLFVPGMGVFKASLTLVDATKLEFNLDAATVSAVEIGVSDVATYNPASSMLEIPAMVYKGRSYKASFRLSGVSATNYRFTLANAQ